MTTYTPDDLTGLPDTVPELKAWAGLLRFHFRIWSNASGEHGYKTASAHMVHIRAMLGLPTAEEEIAAAQATTSETEVVGGEQFAKSAKSILTVEAVKAAKFARVSDKGGVIVSRSNASDRLTMVKFTGGYHFTVDAGRLGERDFGVVDDAVRFINEVPK